MQLVRKLSNSLGPGLLMAAAAIGVSHLVQATRAGASFGYDLMILIVIANLFKYPFFEFGHRYFVATGETLLHGYQRLGRNYLLVFLILNLFTSIASIAAVTFVTGALCQDLFSAGIPLSIWCLAIVTICILLISLGNYRALDLSIKALMLILLIATLSAFFAALKSHTSATNIIEPASPWTWSNIGFFIALMGWMPAPIELSVWQSLWMEAKDKFAGTRTSLKQAQLDFNIGYGVTILLALVFCALGALIMYQSGVSFSSKPAAFAGQVIELYTSALGSWARPLISIAAIATMFSTTITLIDAYPRSTAEGTLVAFPEFKIAPKSWMNICLIATCCFSLVVILILESQLKFMVDLVTILAFLTAPFFAFLNWRIMNAEHVDIQFRPGLSLNVLSCLGLIYLLIFSCLFIFSKYFL